MNYKSLIIQFMRKTIISLAAMLAMSVGVMADEVPGVTVEYVDSGTSAYVQAISAIGRIEFTSGEAVIVFKDSQVENYSLGSISSINRISFGKVSEENISDDVPSSTANVEQKIIVTAYPNPTADHVHVSGMAEGESLRLFTSDGRLAYVGTSPDIDLSGMPSGIYILQVGKEVVKIIKK